MSSQSAFDFGNCSFISDNFQFRIRRSVYGLIAASVVGWVGAIHGCVWLLVAYRIKWFSLIQFYVIVNQAIVDLLTSVIWAISATRMVIVTPFPCNFVEVAKKEETILFNCQLIHFAGNIMLTLSQRSALIVAFDRVYSLLFPVRWLTEKVTYRYCLIAVAWTWSVLQEGAWLVAVHTTFTVADCLTRYNYPKNTTCDHVKEGTRESCCYNTELQCLRHPSTLPHSVQTWLNTVTYVSDGSAFLLTILFYLVIPALASGFCRRVMCGNPNVDVYWSAMEAHQKKMLVRVRLVSFATLINYFVTIGFGFICTDFLSNENFGVSLSQTAGVAVLLGNTVLSVYLFAWKDASFRRELMKCLKAFVTCSIIVPVSESGGSPEVSDSRL